MKVVLRAMVWFPSARTLIFVRTRTLFIWMKSWLSSTSPTRAMSQASIAIGRQMPEVTSRGPQSQPNWYGALRTWGELPGSLWGSAASRALARATGEPNRMTISLLPERTKGLISNRQPRNMLSVSAIFCPLRKSVANVSRPEATSSMWLLPRTEGASLNSRRYSQSAVSTHWTRRSLSR